MPRLLCRVEVGESCFLVKATVHNLSKSGVALRIRLPIACEKVLKVSLTNAAGLFSCTRRTVVRNIRPQEQGDFVVGCEFDMPLSYDEIRRLSS